MKYHYPPSPEKALVFLEYAPVDDVHRWFSEHKETIQKIVPPTGTPLAFAALRRNDRDVLNMVRIAGLPFDGFASDNSHIWHWAALRSVALPWMFEHLDAASLTTINQANNDGILPLHAACGAHTASDEVLQTQVDNVRLMLEHGADPCAVGTNGNTALHLASDPRAVHTLLLAGALPNVCNKDGETPLWRAVSSPPSLEIVQALLNAGALPNVYNKDGETPLWRAVSSIPSVIEVVQTLLNAGALPIPNACNKDGETVLWMAINSRSPLEVVRALLSAGTSPTIIPPHAESVLRIAIRRYNRDIVDALYKCGADPFHVEPDGETPWAAAHEWPDLQVQWEKDRLHATLASQEEPTGIPTPRRRL